MCEKFPLAAFRDNRIVWNPRHAQINAETRRAYAKVAARPQVGSNKCVDTYSSKCTGPGHRNKQALD